MNLLSNSNASFSSIFLSHVDSFNVFSYRRVITITQSLNLAYLTFNFHMYSLLIKIAILVSRAVELDMVLPALGFNFPKVLELIVKTDPVKSLVININIFFFFNLLCFSYNNQYHF